MAVAAIDTHAHVFARGLPLAARRRYAPQYDATLPHYLAQLDAHAISHGVLVQPSFLGTDCSYLLAALAQEPQRLRGVVVIDPATDCAKVDALHHVGVVGMRLNLFDQPNPDFARTDWQQTLAAIARLGWHVEVHVEARRLEHVVPPLLDKGINVVIDHLGRPDPALGIADPGFRYLLTLGFTRQVWVKLSGAYRIGYGAQGEVLKAFNTLDGHGIKLLASVGIASAIITGRQSEIVASRAKELGIAHLYQGVHDKTTAFAQLLEVTGLAAGNCAYMGDDWPDLAVMTRVGFAAAPANAHPEVIARAHWVAEAQGGQGAVREVCDTLLRAQHHYDALLASACGI